MGESIFFSGEINYLGKNIFRKNRTKFLWNNHFFAKNNFFGKNLFFWKNLFFLWKSFFFGKINFFLGKIIFFWKNLIFRKNHFFGKIKFFGKLFFFSNFLGKNLLLWKNQIFGKNFWKFRVLFGQKVEYIDFSKTLVRLLDENASTPPPSAQSVVEIIPFNETVIYNRIPKTASTAFTHVLYDLAKGNSHL